MAPSAEQQQTNIRAVGKLKRNPLRMDRNSEPGIANVCKLLGGGILVLIWFSDLNIITKCMLIWSRA